ncbi:MAG: hypothetical protein GMKNLPBB_00958 [Myxococcota bacterium]|nr:hypothetical protein [Myxococcota bacterium]
MGGAAEEGDPKKGTVHVNVIPMIDMLILLLVFQLTNFATSTFEDAADILAAMPSYGQSPSEEEPPPDAEDKIQSLTIMVSKLSEAELEATVNYTTTLSGAGSLGPFKIPAEFDQNNEMYTILYAELTNELYELKKNYPTHKSAIIRVDRNIRYEFIVQLMDAVRQKTTTVGEGAERKVTEIEELFPQISITDTGRDTSEDS